MGKLHDKKFFSLYRRLFVCLLLLVFRPTFLAVRPLKLRGGGSLIFPTLPLTSEDEWENFPTLPLTS